MKTFENYYTVKFSAKETKWTLLEVRTLPTFLFFSLPKLPNLSRNGPLVPISFSEPPLPLSSAMDKDNGGSGNEIGQRQLWLQFYMRAHSLTGNAQNNATRINLKRIKRLLNISILLEIY